MYEPSGECLGESFQSRADDGVLPVEVEDCIRDIRSPFVGMNFQPVKDMLVTGDHVLELADVLQENHVQIRVPTPVLVDQDQADCIAIG